MGYELACINFFCLFRFHSYLITTVLDSLFSTIPTRSCIENVVCLLVNFTIRKGLCCISEI